MPEIEIAGPEVDLAAAREYGETGILGAVTDADELLTRANQQGAVEYLRMQAGGAVPLAADVRLEAAAAAAGYALARAGYFGPFGIDAFRHRTDRGEVLNALSEINARFTMDWPR